MNPHRLQIEKGTDLSFSVALPGKLSVLHEVQKSTALKPVRSYPGYGIDRSGHLLALPGFVNLEHSGQISWQVLGMDLEYLWFILLSYKLKGKEGP